MAIATQEVNAAVEKVAKEGARKSALKLTPVLRDQAFRAEWPSEIVIELSVKAEDENLYISYPDEFDSRIEDLEYGSQSQPPRPVLRPFMARYASNLEEEITESVVDILSDMGALS